VKSDFLLDRAIAAYRRYLVSTDRNEQRQLARDISVDLQDMSPSQTDRYYEQAQLARKLLLAGELEGTVRADR
jgi:hypothetical protein